MRNQFTVLLISSLLVSACFATVTYPSSTYTTNCTGGQLHLTVAPATTCATASACTGGASDVAPTSATANSAATSTTAVGDCKYCDATHAWDSLLYSNCAVKASGACVTGYSDVAPTGSPLANQAATSGSITGACINCAPNYYYNMPSAVTGVVCVSKSDTTNGKCATGYTDSSTGAAASATGSLTGDCKYCLTGYSDVAPTGTPAANVAATTGGAVGACKYCAPNYYWNQPSAVTGGACVLKSDTTNGKCATGYTDKSDGTAASAAGSLTGDCKYCLAGTSDLAPAGTPLVNTNATAAGAVGACKYCSVGYTQTAVGSACTAGSSGSSASFLMVSISLMATLIMIFF